MTFLERFWSKVEVTDTCWLWTGHLNKKGKYGHIRTGLGESKVVAHRFSWEFINQIPVPDGLELDHLCRVRICVNPSHLEPVTHKTNIYRGMSPAAIHARKTHCIHGHEFSVENTYVNPITKHRQCKTCRGDVDKQRYLNDPRRRARRKRIAH